MEWDAGTCMGSAVGAPADNGLAANMMHKATATAVRSCCAVSSSSPNLASRDPCPSSTEVIADADQPLSCSGVVQDFDRLRHRHTISYQDGDIEIIPLWAPNQMVSLALTSFLQSALLVTLVCACQTQILCILVTFCSFSLK